ncbi:acyl transferase domain protein [Mycobacterium ulcerans str. Harvey]|uniref:Acyl transferase domain protein n=1 Tax=Mycobacterium ulcerans str. Harvey TaxID=1299332 RepID=A0ABN0QYR1_MYCUL|nr:acyl transferase domain protein [Mycobacterium ulcerans str. Harvey]
MGTSELDGGYWFRSIRQTVQFAEAVRAAGAQGYGVFVEASAHPLLLNAIEETLAEETGDAAKNVVVVPTLGRDDGGLGRFWMSAGQAHVAGVGMDWRAVYAGWVRGWWNCQPMRSSGSGSGCRGPQQDRSILRAWGWVRLGTVCCAPQSSIPIRGR